MALTEVRCPRCRRLAPRAGNPFRPFCSERCKLADLGAWASEQYRLPGPTVESEESSEQDEDEPSDSPSRTRH